MIQKSNSRTNKKKKILSRKCNQNVKRRKRVRILYLPRYGHPLFVNNQEGSVKLISINSTVQDHMKNILTSSVYIILYQ